MTDATHIYFIKYWQTQGISKVPIEKCDMHSTVIRINAMGNCWHCIGSECFYTEEEAIAAVETLRQKAIQSAEKKIAKLRNLDPKKLIKDFKE